VIRSWVRFAIALLGVTFAAGCGGASSSGNNATPTTTPAPGPSAGGNSSGLGTPSVVSVGGGQTVGGIDIAVASPASTLNAQVLGVANVGTGGSAFNTGSLIHRGTTMKVLLFGPGLGADNIVTISGPDDINIAAVASIMSTSGMTGVSFTATVAGNAALGARTVFLKNGSNDVTAFTGGLEVVP